MTDPVEELVRALEEALTPSAPTTEPVKRDQFIAVQMTGAGYDRLLASISRFNAERGKGVWAPRKATAEMIGGIRKGEFRRRALYEQMGFSSSEAFQKAKPTDYDIYEDMLAEAMIAAINPDEKT